MQAISGVPDKISRSEVIAFLHRLGLTTDRIPAASPVEVGYRSIKVCVFAEDEHGHLIVDDKNEFARHTLSIPVVDDLEMDAPAPTASQT